MPDHSDDLFLFPGAGEGAQPEVIEAIERFRALPIEERRKVVSLWGWLLGDSGTPVYKHVKPGVRYLHPSPFPDRNCGNCQSTYIHKATGIAICDRMRGVIDEDAWCDRWHAPRDPGEYAEYQERGHEELDWARKVSALVDFVVLLG